MIRIIVTGLSQEIPKREASDSEKREWKKVHTTIDKVLWQTFRTATIAFAADTARSVITVDVFSDEEDEDLQEIQTAAEQAVTNIKEGIRSDLSFLKADTEVLDIRVVVFSVVQLASAACRVKE
ncbi:MAG: hypothetical protein V1716_02820 [Candidatus Uhrbacteria bacterium]